MKLAQTTSLMLLGALLTAGVAGVLESNEPAGREMAAVGRYHLRQRTQRFFERSTPAGRDAQKGVYQSLPRPTASPAKCETTAVS